MQKSRRFHGEFDLIDHNDRRSRGPEILPPTSQEMERGQGAAQDGPSDYDLRSGYYTQPPQPPHTRSRILTGWAYAPATYILIGISCAVYLAMVLNGVSWWDPTAEQILHWGANNGLLELHGQWWRLVTATFLHIGIIHIGTNMWCLWNLGLLGEPLLGPVGNCCRLSADRRGGKSAQLGCESGCNWGGCLWCRVRDCGCPDIAAELASFALSQGRVKAIAPQRDLFRSHQSRYRCVHPSVFRRYQDR